MKKNLFIASCILLFSIQAYSQVGINTTTPQASFDIQAKNATGTSSSIEGLLVPRVDRQRAQSMVGTPVSTLVYVNDISTGSTLGTTVDVITTGYYYFNGTKWVSLSASTGIVGNNWSLTGNTGTNSSSNFIGTIDAQPFNIRSNNTNILTVSPNLNVGIGTTAPTNKLHINNFTDPLRLEGLQPAGNNIAGSLVVDNTGVVKSIPINNSIPIMLVGGDIADALPEIFYDYPGGSVGAAHDTVLKTISFTLGKRSIVDFSASISVSFTAFGFPLGNGVPVTNLIQDGKARVCLIYFRFTNVPTGSSIPVNTTFAINSAIYTNSNSGTLPGPIYTTPSGILDLPAGSYTFTVMGSELGQSSFRAYYGRGGSDRIHVKATPLL